MAKAKVNRRKSSVSAREKRARRARAAREARREAQLDRGVRQRLTELFSAQTPPDRAAALWLEHLGGDPVMVRFSRAMAASATPSHARAVAEGVARLAPDSVPALSFAADVALQLEGAEQEASALIDRALDVAEDPEVRVALADHLLELGRVADALAMVEDRMIDRPDDSEAQEIRAGALRLAHRRAAVDAEVPDRCPCWSGLRWADCCREAEARALERFADRGRLDALRGAMRRFAALSADLAEAIASHVERWLDDAGELARRSEARDALLQAATEHAWLAAGDDESDDDDDSPLPRFAASSSVPPTDRQAAQRWLAHAQYGLWQISDPTPGPGVWALDLLTSTRRYVAIPPVQLDGVARWTVLLGALVAVDGTWRTTSTLIPLRPTEAEAVVELAEELVYHVVSSASGRELKREPRGPGSEEPAGVLAGQSEQAGPEYTSFVSTVVGSGMPRLLALIGELRTRAPKLCNTDRDPLCLIKATVVVGDPYAAAERLASRPDFRREEDALTWWGREMDDLERASAQAEVRSMLRERGEDPEAVAVDESQRWIRGTIKPLAHGLEVDVNSRERLERLLALLHDLGEDPAVSEQLVIDPSQDMALPPLGAMMTLGPSSRDSHEAWLTHLPDQPLPALHGRTPRQAAARPRDAARLEAFLRELEHDADILVSRGAPAPDISRLREELQAPAEAWM